jgi:hypothetical protein
LQLATADTEPALHQYPALQFPVGAVRAVPLHALPPEHGLHINLVPPYEILPFDSFDAMNVPSGQAIGCDDPDL